MEAWGSWTCMRSIASLLKLVCDCRVMGRVGEVGR